MGAVIRGDYESYLQHTRRNKKKKKELNVPRKASTNIIYEGSNAAPKNNVIWVDETIRDKCDCKGEVLWHLFRLSRRDRGSREVLARNTHRRKKNVFENPL